MNKNIEYYIVFDSEHIFTSYRNSFMTRQGSKTKVYSRVVNNMPGKSRDQEFKMAQSMNYNS